MAGIVRLLLVMVLATAPGFTRDDKGSWENLDELQVGQKIEVTDVNLKSQKGTLVSHSDGAILLSTRKGELRLERAQVLQVSDREHTRRGRNALIGSAVGGGIGGLIGGFLSVLGGDGGPVSAGWVAAGIGLGGGIGGSLGALIPSYRTVYRVKRGKSARKP